jgi:biotin carboxyl carrier protein
VASTPEGRRAIARLAEQVLPVLIARLSASDLGELEVHEGGWRVRLRRDPATAGNANASTAAPGERTTGTTRGTVGDRDRTSGTDRGPGSDRGDRGDRSATSRSAASRRAATSPAVGYFTPRAGLAVGQPIRAGDVVGHVDVLGVPVDVVAPADGRLGRLYAAAGEAVEYGQELVRIDSVESGVAGVGPGTDGAPADHAGADGVAAAGVGAVNLESTEAVTDVGIETAPAAMVE